MWIYFTEVRAVKSKVTEKMHWNNNRFLAKVDLCFQQKLPTCYFNASQLRIKDNFSHPPHQTMQTPALRASCHPAAISEHTSNPFKTLDLND